MCWAKVLMNWDDENFSSVRTIASIFCYGLLKHGGNTNLNQLCTNFVTNITELQGIEQRIRELRLKCDIYTVKTRRASLPVQTANMGHWNQQHSAISAPAGWR